MPSSPAISRYQNAVSRSLPSRLETVARNDGGGGPSPPLWDELVHSALFLLQLQALVRRVRTGRSVPYLRIVPKLPTTRRRRIHSRFLQLHPTQLNRNDMEQQDFYRAVPRVLGQYVRRVIGFSGGLGSYLDWQARERLMADRLADRLPKLPREGLLAHYRGLAMAALEAEIHVCVTHGRWVDQPMSRVRFAACLSRRPQLKRVKRQSKPEWVVGGGEGFFLIVERRGEAGGRIAAVHEASRFDRIARKPRVTTRHALRPRVR